MSLWRQKSVLSWISYDFANSAYATIVLAVIFNQYFAGVIAAGTEGVAISLPFVGSIVVGVVPFPGAALWTFLVALSTAVVALTSPLMGAMADQSSRRKTFLIVYCLVGVVCTIALASVGKGQLWQGTVLFLLANLGFAGGNVFYNSFLIDISPTDKLGRVSGVAWGIGYLGGGLCLMLCLMLLTKPDLFGLPVGLFKVNHCMILAGIWWLIFALPAFFWLKDKPDLRKEKSMKLVITNGWGQVYRTFKNIRQYKNLIKFLVAYLIFNDGIETVIIMASIFGAQVVGLAADELIVFFILIQITGLIGSFFFGWLADVIGKKVALLISIAVWLVVVGWASQIGFLFGAKIDYYLMGVMAGIVMGGSQTVARSLQAMFTPPDKAAEFFGFYAVSGRVASIFGPLIYGTAIIIMGDIKSGILSLGIFFLVGGIILMFVNEKDTTATII